MCPSPGANRTRRSCTNSSRSRRTPGPADQIAAEAHVKVITDLLDHSLTPADGPAPNYLAMMREPGYRVEDWLWEAKRVRSSAAR